MEILDVFDKLPENEQEYWAMIEYIGGIIWRTKHDWFDQRHWVSDNDFQEAMKLQEVQEKLVAEVCEKYNVIHLKDQPQVAFGEELPPAPIGKTYYWDWYSKQKAIIEGTYVEEEHKTKSSKRTIVKLNELN